jgi:EAL domain-containing protein (putative c-di-GMP-specific phosphodiesterase class I)
MTLAEGVETEAEAEVCRQIGFDLLQGYLTGRPAPLDSLRA